MDVNTFIPSPHTAPDEKPTDLKKDIQDNGLFVLTPDGVGSKDTYVSHNKKLEILADETKLTEQAQKYRAATCAWHDCHRLPVAWGIAVRFDLKHDDANLRDYTVLKVDDLGEELPGFCFVHLEKASYLAEHVYAHNPVVQMGLRPNRWIIEFTDGTTMGGPISKIAPTLPKIKIKDEHLSSE